MTGRDPRSKKSSCAAPAVAWLDGPVRLGSVHAFFLYDVAEAIDLGRVQQLVGPTVPARLAPRATTPPYVQYQQPPIAIDGQSVGMPDLDGFHVRFKTFDYGVISVALTRALPDAWDALLQQGLGWYDNPALSAGAERYCRALLDRLAPAVTRARPDFLTEDYLDDISRFAVEHTAMARGEFLELTIVLLIVLEIVLALTRP